MNSFLDLLDLGVKVALDEGRRFAQARIAQFIQGVIRGIRMLLLIHYLIQTLCFLTAFGLFFSLYQGVLLYSQLGRVEFTPMLLLGLLVFIISTLFLWLTVREKTWYQALQVEELLRQLHSKDSSKTLTDEEMIEAMIDRILEKKLKEK